MCGAVSKAEQLVSETGLACGSRGQGSTSCRRDHWYVLSPPLSTAFVAFDSVDTLLSGWGSSRLRC